MPLCLGFSPDLYSHAAFHPYSSISRRESDEARLASRGEGGVHDVNPDMIFECRQLANMMKSTSSSWHSVSLSPRRTSISVGLSPDSEPPMQATVKSQEKIILGTAQSACFLRSNDRELAVQCTTNDTTNTSSHASTKATRQRVLYLQFPL